ncbi:MAG: DUF4286 family protein [Bacteroidia bacterium]|nr:DUF4286 family protein [Bacteroidia bacterium]MCO5255047.1 DUF4286 family protein [Bacteroidota bacterium]MCZ2129804.1 DUF4286 family protein [Bacteroidia bacterium]
MYFYPMYYYNVTCHAEHAIETKWLEWMKHTHIPEVMQTGCFTECRMLKLISPEHIEHGPTYAIQYLYNSPTDFDKYIAKHADVLRDKTFKEFGNAIHAFRTQLEIIAQF